MEREAAAAPPDAASAARAAEAAALLHGGANDLPLAPRARVEGAHDSNVLAVRLWPGRDLLATGAGARAGRLHV